MCWAALLAVLRVTPHTLPQLIGVAVIAVTGYVLDFNGDFDEVSPSFMTYIALGTGVVVVLISLLACLAACNYTKPWAKIILMVYSFVLFVVLAMEIGAAAMVWMKREELKGCEYVQLQLLWSCLASVGALHTHAPLGGGV